MPLFPGDTESNFGSFSYLLGPRAPIPAFFRRKSTDLEGLIFVQGHPLRAGYGIASYHFDRVPLTGGDSGGGVGRGDGKEGEGEAMEQDEGKEDVGEAEAGDGSTVAAAASGAAAAAAATATAAAAAAAAAADPDEDWDVYICCEL